MVDTTLSDQPFQDKTVLTDDRLVFLENEYTQTQKTNLAEIYEFYQDKNDMLPYLGQVNASVVSPNTLLDKTGWYEVLTGLGTPVSGWPSDISTTGNAIITTQSSSTTNALLQTLDQEQYGAYVQYRRVRGESGSMSAWVSVKGEALLGLFNANDRNWPNNRVVFTGNSVLDVSNVGAYSVEAGSTDKPPEVQNDSGWLEQYTNISRDYGVIKFINGLRHREFSHQRTNGTNQGWQEYALFKRETELENANNYVVREDRSDGWMTYYIRVISRTGTFTVNLNQSYADIDKCFLSYCEISGPNPDPIAIGLTAPNVVTFYDVTPTQEYTVKVEGFRISS